MFGARFVLLCGRRVLPPSAAAAASRLSASASGRRTGRGSSVLSRLSSHRSGGSGGVTLTLRRALASTTAHHNSDKQNNSTATADAAATEGATAEGSPDAGQGAFRVPVFRLAVDLSKYPTREAAIAAAAAEEAARAAREAGVPPPPEVDSEPTPAAKQQPQQPPPRKASSQQTPPKPSAPRVAPQFVLPSSRRPPHQQQQQQPHQQSPFGSPPPPPGGQQPSSSSSAATAKPTTRMIPREFEQYIRTPQQQPNPATGQKPPPPQQPYTPPLLVPPPNLKGEALKRWRLQAAHAQRRAAQNWADAEAKRQGLAPPPRLPRPWATKKVAHATGGAMGGWQPGDVGADPDAVPLTDSQFFQSLGASQRAAVAQMDRDMEKLMSGAAPLLGHIVGGGGDNKNNTTSTSNNNDDGAAGAGNGTGAPAAAEKTVNAHGWKDSAAGADGSVGGGYGNGPRDHIKKLLLKVHPDRFNNPTDPVSVRTANTKGLAQLNSILDFHSQLSRREVLKRGGTANASAAAPNGGVDDLSKEPAPPTKQTITFFYRRTEMDDGALAKLTAEAVASLGRAPRKSTEDSAFGKCELEVHVASHLKGQDALFYLDKVFFKLMQTSGVELPLPDILQWRETWTAHAARAAAIASAAKSGASPLGGVAGDVADPEAMAAATANSPLSGIGGFDPNDPMAVFRDATLSESEVERRARFGEFAEFLRAQHTSATEQGDPNLTLFPFMSEQGLIAVDHDAQPPITHWQQVQALDGLRRAIEQHWHAMRCGEWAGFGVFITHRFGQPSKGWFCIPWKFEVDGLVRYFADYADDVAASATAAAAERRRVDEEERERAADAADEAMAAFVAAGPGARRRGGGGNGGSGAGGGK